MTVNKKGFQERKIDASIPKVCLFGVIFFLEKILTLNGNHWYLLSELSKLLDFDKGFRDQWKIALKVFWFIKKIGVSLLHCVDNFFNVSFVAVQGLFN